MRRIVKSFDRDLCQLSAMVDRMGRQVQRLIEQRARRPILTRRVRSAAAPASSA